MHMSEVLQLWPLPLLLIVVTISRLYTAARLARRAPLQPERRDLEAAHGAPRYRRRRRRHA